MITQYEQRLDHTGCDHVCTNADMEQAETAACEVESALSGLESIGFTPANLDEVHRQLRLLRHAWDYLNVPQLPND